MPLFVSITLYRLIAEFNKMKKKKNKTEHIMDQSFRIRLIGGNLTSIDFILLLINLYIEIAHVNSRHLKIIIGCLWVNCAP